MARTKKRPDGRYHRNITIIENGIKRRKSIYGLTIKECDEKVLVAREKAMNHQSAAMLIKDWAAQWFGTYKSMLAFNTRRMYKGALKNHILPSLGEMRFSDVQELHAQALLNDLTERGLDRMAQQVYITLNQVYETARKNKIIKENIMLDIKSPKYESPEKRALTEQEIAIIKSTLLPTKSRAFVLLLLDTGVRRAEALGLTRDDIDFTKKCVSVNKSLYFESNQPKYKDTKSKAGKRVIPLSDELLPTLERHIKSLEGDILFPSAQGELMTESAFQCFWRKISSTFKSAGIEADDVTPHLFRHTFASTILWKGANLKDAQYVMGHSSLKITADLYAHFNPKAKENIREVLNRKEAI